jgi:hypothetical protein
MQQVADIKQELLEELENLYKDVITWVNARGLLTSRSRIVLREEEVGEYEAPVLQVIDGDHIIASLRPVGASIIGANGRVDLEGKVVSEILSLLEAGGPSITISEGIPGGTSPQRTHRLFSEVSESGWYWIESRTRGRAHQLTSEVFFDLLKRVSNYGIGK